MAQFDVYANTNQHTKAAIPFLLDIQSDILDILATRVVVPLVAAAVAGKAASHLNPQFEIQQIPVVMSTAELAGVSRQVLGEKVCSLKEQHNEIVAAFDFLISGF